jgi:hypothetical protein
MSGTRSAAAESTGWCCAVSQHGTPVTARIGGMAALVIAKPGQDFICTQDPGHAGSHAACDGEGHILARWPRRAGERYWERADCKDHDHGPPPSLPA